MKKCLYASPLLILYIFAGSLKAESLLPIRAWQFHDYNPRYIERTLELAPEYNVNTVVFSHAIMWYAEEIFYDHYKPRYINLWSEKAHRLGLKAWVWTHELNAVPLEFLTGPQGKPRARKYSAWIGKLHEDFEADARVNIDKPEFWNWVKAKYEKLFTIIPEVDGLILSMHETPYRIFADDAVVSKLSKPERITKLITVINEVCREYNKRLVVRTFVIEAEELEWIHAGINDSPADVIVMTKVVPHDWYPYLPNHPLLGQFPDHRQILEMGTNAENGGMNLIPYPQADYIKMRLDYALSKGVEGYVARLEIQNNHVLGTPNEISLHAMHRFTEDINFDTDILWKEWATLKYGVDAAPYMISALRPAFEGVNKMFFFQGMWLTDHSRIPPYEYALGHISSRSPAKWSGEKQAHYATMEKAMNQPSLELLDARYWQKRKRLFVFN